MVPCAYQQSLNSSVLNHLMNQLVDIYNAEKIQWYADGLVYVEDQAMTVKSSTEGPINFITTSSHLEHCPIVFLNGMEVFHLIS